MSHRYSLLAALAFCSSSLTAHALEATANRTLDVDASLGMKVDAMQAALTTVINQMLVCSKQGKDFVADSSVAGRDANGCVARSATDGTKCTVTNKIYDPTDSTADGDGCVTAAVVPEDVTKNSNVGIDDYPGSYIGNKGWIGSGFGSVDFKPFVEDGATSFSIDSTRSGFNGANPVIVIANAAASYGGGFVCHYDSSPNRNHDLYWSYNGTNKVFTWESRLYQVWPTKPAVTITMSVKYTALRLKFGKE